MLISYLYEITWTACRMGYGAAVAVAIAFIMAILTIEFIICWTISSDGATLSTIPVLIVYAMFQRQIIKGITLTGIGRQ